MNKLAVLLFALALVFVGCARQDQAEQLDESKSQEQVEAQHDPNTDGPTAEQIKAQEDRIANKPYSPPKNPNFKSKPWVVDDRCKKYVAEFRWPQEAPTLESSISAGKGDYEVSHTPADPLRRVIKFEKTGNVILQLKGHRFTVFRIVGDILYFADFYSIKNGCRVVSYNLQTGKKLWETELLGILWVVHSCYSNRVNLEFEDGLLVVWGHEDGGDYVECLEAATGRILAHHIFRHYAPGQLEQCMKWFEYGEDKNKIVKKNLFGK
jgi:hypothetical protein